MQFISFILLHVLPNIPDHQGAILSSGEEMLVVGRNGHLSNWAVVSSEFKITIELKVVVIVENLNGTFVSACDYTLNLLVVVDVFYLSKFADCIK